MLKKSFSMAQLIKTIWRLVLPKNHLYAHHIIILVLSYENVYFKNLSYNKLTKAMLVEKLVI